MEPKFEKLFANTAKFEKRSSYKKGIVLKSLPKFESNRSIFWTGKHFYQNVAIKQGKIATGSKPKRSKFYVCFYCSITTQSVIFNQKCPQRDNFKPNSKNRISLDYCLIHRKISPVRPCLDWYKNSVTNTKYISASC